MFYFNISAKSMPFLVLMSSFYDRFACLKGHFGAISRLMLSVHCKFREGRAVWAPSLKSVTLLTGGPNWIFWCLDWSKNVTSMTGGGNWPYRCLDWCKNVTSLNHPLWSSACSSAFTPFWGWTESDKPRHHCTDKIIFTRITATATPSSYISLNFIIKRMGVDLSKWGWTKLIGMPVDIPFSAVYLGSFLFPFVSEKIFHCKPNLAQSLNIYSTHCVDNLSCPLIRNFFFARTQQFLSE